MLILSRKEGESLVLGDQIVIKIISTNKGIVKLGIEAPKHILILRDELAQAVKTKNIESATKMNEEDIEMLKIKIKKND